VSYKYGNTAAPASSTAGNLVRFADTAGAVAIDSGIASGTSFQAVDLTSVDTTISLPLPIEGAEYGAIVTEQGSGALYISGGSTTVLDTAGVAFSRAKCVVRHGTIVYTCINGVWVCTNNTRAWTWENV
jgi:hypothetical protein